MTTPDLTTETLDELRGWAEDYQPVGAKWVLALIEEVERLRATVARVEALAEKWVNDGVPARDCCGDYDADEALFELMDALAGDPDE